MTITYHPLVRPEADGDPREAARDLAERTRAVIATSLAAHAGLETSPPGR
jgi:hypothetical protein